MPTCTPTRRLQLLLSAVYVFGCAYRSVSPVFDIPRICLFDSWLSSVAVGRSVATCAELCFVAQWAVMLREISDTTGSRFGQIASQALLPMMLVAELCSWYSVLTTSNIGHVVEESLWGVSATLLVASVRRQLGALHPAAPPRAGNLGRCGRSLRRLYICGRCADVLVSVDRRPSPRPPVPEHRARHTGRLQPLAGVVPLGRLEERSHLDVGIFQRRGVVEHRTDSRSGIPRDHVPHCARSPGCRSPSPIGSCGWQLELRSRLIPSALYLRVAE